MRPPGWRGAGRRGPICGEARKPFLLSQILLDFELVLTPVRGCWRPAPPQVSYRQGPLRSPPDPEDSGEAATTESTRIWTRVSTDAHFSQGSTWGLGRPLRLTLIFPTLPLLKLPFCHRMSLRLGSAAGSSCRIQALDLERVERPRGASWILSCRGCGVPRRGRQLEVLRRHGVRLPV